MARFCRPIGTAKTGLSAASPLKKNHREVEEVK
jgi:hypothetical protein